jgi:mannose-6-phosphate isomerase
MWYDVSYMNEFTAYDLEIEDTPSDILDRLIEASSEQGFAVVERVDDKPWGAMVRFDYRDADKFIELFFPDLDPVEARLGIEGAKLSPKFLVVKPHHRLSWQYHDRRAERWAYLTDGLYMRSSSDHETAAIAAQAGDIVQFTPGERHRLIGGDQPTIVAEIWQHTDADNPSDEDDIVRVSDDYNR